jgi:hypothetical protein
MDLISLLYILFIVIYAGILGLVAPYVGVKSEHYGSYVPTALAITSGSVLWILLTWVGMPYDQAWIWIIVMLGMPAAMWFGGNVIEARRSSTKTA